MIQRPPLPFVRRPPFRRLTALGPVFALAALACGRTVIPQAAAYAPRVRELTVTTVPLLVKEQQGVLPFLKEDFAKGGVLEGKEVYGFSPSTLIVVEGDTVHFTFINPEDDVHSFVLPDFAVSLPGQKVTKATYVARHAGIFIIECAVQTHLPMMAGQFVVLAPGAVASVAPTSR